MCEPYFIITISFSLEFLIYIYLQNSGHTHDEICAEFTKVGVSVYLCSSIKNLRSSLCLTKKKCMALSKNRNGLLGMTEQLTS
jgi:hypothetical protein